jgi:hypothetical protein
VCLYMRNVGILGSLLPAGCQMDQNVESGEILISTKYGGHLLVLKQTQIVDGLGELAQKAAAHVAIGYEGGKR